MQHFILAHTVARKLAIEAVQNAPAGFHVRISEPTRSLMQNARLWVMLNEVARQVDWYGQKLTDEEWKDVFTAAIKKQKVVPGIDGGFVVCGERTSKMTVKELSDLLELIAAFGVQRGVIFHDERTV